MQDLSSNFKQAAREAAELNQQMHRVAEAGALQRHHAAEACRQNPYQPSLATWFGPAGLTIDLDLREQVSRDIYIFGATEPSLLRFLADALQPGDVFVDAGAHVGFFTLIASRLVGAEGAVHSFEPTPDTNYRLQANVQRNNLKNVNIYQAALWEENKTLQFNDFGAAYNAYNSFSAMRHADRPLVEPRVWDVEAVTLDNFCISRSLKPSFIKIDVENAEYQVLSGSMNTLRSARPILSIEMGDYIADDPAVHASAESLHVVSAADYCLFELLEDRIAPHTISDRYSYSNIICIPAERVDAFYR
jgi:FkbM family methyltransferase